MIERGLSSFKGKRILLLQGPVGPFFKRFACDLARAGAVVTKIDFNGGDWLFSPSNSIAYRGSMEQWPAFLEQIFVERKIDVLFLFGDCRPIHRTVHDVGLRRGIEIGVFEEGYVRPDYITLERFGVNGHSRIPRNPVFYLNRPIKDVHKTIAVGRTFWYAAWWATLYYLASTALWPLFRRYEHHRPLTLLEGLPWLRSAWRKLYFRRQEKGIQEELASRLASQFFLVPLQVHNDAQVHVHSGFDSVATFIDTVVTSFARFAPVDTYLVIKHHPMDRGYRDHTRLIGSLARRHGIQARVRYIHDQHLPTLLEHARGVVVVNSTVGLSALHHGTPLMVCGVAIYDMKGLTFQGELDDFWNQAKVDPVDPDLYLRFRSCLIEHTQLNGSFYRQLNIADSCAGLEWGSDEKPIDPQRAADKEDVSVQVDEVYFDNIASSKR